MSPEHLVQSFHLTQELRLSKEEINYDDKLQVGTGFCQGTCGKAGHAGAHWNAEQCVERLPRCCSHRITMSSSERQGRERLSHELLVLFISCYLVERVKMVFPSALAGCHLPFFS